MNNLNGLIPTIYESLDTVSRELVGAIPASTLDMSAKTAKDQPIVFPVVPEATATDVVPGQLPPTSYTGEKIGHRTLSIKKERSAWMLWNGNEVLSLGEMRSPIVRNQITQRIRTIVNEAEKDLCAVGVSEALSVGNYSGTVGTAPFATDLKPLTEILKKMEDNGTPTGDLQAVLNTEAGMNLRNLKQLQSVADAGERSLLRQGILGSLMGFNIRESGGLRPHEKGTGTGFTVNASAGLKAGTTEIVVDGGATGGLKAGDIIGFTGYNSRYVVAEDVELSATLIKIATPLTEDIADDTALIYAGNYNPSILFDRGALMLATRSLAVPTGGDSARDVQVVTDPVSGLSLTVSLYKEYKQERVEIGMAWGAGAIKPSDIYCLLG